jgi:uncharacterized membrane protein
MKLKILIVAIIIIWAFVIYQSNKAWKNYQKYLIGVEMLESIKKTDKDRN